MILSVELLEGGGLGVSQRGLEGGGFRRAHDAGIGQQTGGGIIMKFCGQDGIRTQRGRESIGRGQRAGERHTGRGRHRFPGGDAGGSIHRDGPGIEIERAGSGQLPLAGIEIHRAAQGEAGIGGGIQHAVVFHRRFGGGTDIDGGGIGGMQVPDLQAAAVDIAEHIDLGGFRQVQAQVGPIAGEIDLHRAVGIVQGRRHGGIGGGIEGKIIGIAVSGAGAVRHGDLRAVPAGETAAGARGDGEGADGGREQDERILQRDAAGPGIQAELRRVDGQHRAVVARARQALRPGAAFQGDAIAGPEIDGGIGGVVELETQRGIEGAVGIVHLVEIQVIRGRDIPGAGGEAQQDGGGGGADVRIGIGAGFQGGGEGRQQGAHAAGLALQETEVAGRQLRDGRTGQQGAGAGGQDEIPGDLIAGEHGHVARAVGTAFAGPLVGGGGRGSVQIGGRADAVAGDQGDIAAGAGGETAQHSPGRGSAAGETVIRRGGGEQPGVDGTGGGIGKQIATGGGVNGAGPGLDVLPGPQIDIPGGGLDRAVHGTAFAAIQINIPAAGGDAVRGEIVTGLEGDGPVVRIGDAGIFVEQDVAGRQQGQLAGGFAGAGGQVPGKSGRQRDIAAGRKGDLGEILVLESGVHIQRPRGVARAGGPVDVAAAVGQGGGGAGTGSREIDVVGIQQQLARRAATGSGGIHAGIQRQDIGRAHFHVATVAAVHPARGDDLTAGGVAESIAGPEDDIAAGAATGGGIAPGENLRVGAKIQAVGGDQGNHAVLVLDGVGLEESVLVHHPGLHGDGTAVGGDAAEIVHGPGGERDLGAQAAAIGSLAHQHLLAGGEVDAAAGGAQAACIPDIFGDEIKRPARADGDPAVIDDAGQRRQAGELPAGSGTQILRGGRGGGDETAAHGDEGIRAEIEAVRIRQNDGAVGGETAKDLRRIGAADQVEHDGIFRGLEERGLFAGGDVEILPAQHGGRADGHVQLRTGLLEGGAAGNDAEAGRIGNGFQGPDRRQEQGGEPAGRVVFGDTFHPGFLKIGSRC